MKTPFFAMWSELATSGSKSRTVQALAVGFIAFACVAASPITWAAPQHQEWLLQIGTPQYDKAEASCSDGSGGVIVGGYTAGTLGQQRFGYEDAWLARFDGSGNLLWLNQFGAAHASDVVHALCLDGAGGFFAAGVGPPDTGSYRDAWVGRFDINGNNIWMRKIGSSSTESLNAITLDTSGGVFVTGETDGDFGGPRQGWEDIWIARLSANGTLLWVRQFGTETRDWSYAVCADESGGVYVGGKTFGVLWGSGFGQYDAWVAHYSSAGVRTWIRQFGNEYNQAVGSIALADHGDVFLGGASDTPIGNGGGGDLDPFIARQKSDGTIMWIRQYGTDGNDNLGALVSDGEGGLFACGETFGSFAGPHAGNADVWIGHFDSLGSPIWLRQIGTVKADRVRTIAALDASGCFVAGSTSGSLGGNHLGSADIWIGHYTPAPVVGPTGYTVNRGTRLSGNVLSMMFSDPYYLKVASAPGEVYEVAETTVRTKSTILDPVRLDLRTETRATTANVQTRIALRNLNSNTWDTVAQFAQPTVDAVQVINNIPNPHHYIRQTDGLIRIRIQMIRAAWRGPFNKWIDHVQVTVWE